MDAHDELFYGQREEKKKAFNRSGTPIPVRVGGLVLVSKGTLEHSARVRGCEPSASDFLEPLGGCLRASEPR